MRRQRAVAILLFFVGVAAALLYRAVFSPSFDAAQEDKRDPAIDSTETAQVSDRAASAVRVARSGLVRREVVLMGTSFVFVIDDSPVAAISAIEAVIERLRVLEQEISSWQPGSDITKLNGRAGIGPVHVGEDTFELLRLSKQLHAETDGAFDVTLGPVWDLWPFR
ncbi:MAG: FAD:protein FMN transferase, partial [Pirellulaceae bacterium]|nr:FAD:protein FMN transferase [Pirellulaceae bacterium]